MRSKESDGTTNSITSSRSRAQNIQRRTSRHASSQDRHGRLFEEPEPATIRAVTPEPANSRYPTLRSNSAETNTIHSPALPPARSRPSQRRREHSASVSNTDEENTIERRRRRAQTRAGTKEEVPLDSSPNSFISKTRKRLGSITTTGGLSQREPEAHGSIGFPSVVQSPDSLDHTDTRNAPRTPRRPFSPEDMLPIPANSLRSPKLLDIDSAKILHLMKTTCGRMHGILFFRPLHTTAWASGYCAINVAPGSLVCQTKGEVSQSKTLIPDLRGCTVRTHYDYETQSTYLSVLIASTGTGYQLRPPVPETFDSWLAALLCWQPLRPKGAHNRILKPQSGALVDKKQVSQRRVSSDLSSAKSTAIVKVGKMLLWDGPLPSGSQLGSGFSESFFMMTEENSLWRRVSSTLHENGLFRLLDDIDARILYTTQLSQLSRCAVLRLDESVLNMRYCLAVYPQYRVQPGPTRLSRPMVLCLETNAAFQAWFVLLRALTVPELYGPDPMRPSSAQSSTHSMKENGSGSVARDMFRIERSLTVKITEAKFHHRFALNQHNEHVKSKGKSVKDDRNRESVYTEVILGKDLRARTTTKQSVTSAFWAEEFTLEDIPPFLSKLTLAVKIANPAEKEWTMVADGLFDISADAGYLSGLGGLEISSHDPIFGRVDISMDELESQGPVDKWWPLLDNNDQVVGQLLVRLVLQETVILMEEEYRELSSILQSFSNSITTQLGRLFGPDLRQLSDILLDIFQASGTARDWINNLIEEEIDGIYKETPMRMRFSGRIHSNDSYESAEQRELLVRDLSRSATMEANLLFRGNSLVTKALDAHMRRLGKDYLEEVLGEKLRKIMERDPDCEVDPNRVRTQEQLDKNWANLLFLTSTIWKAIHVSASRCPVDLRLIFRHVRSCAEDRYGSFIRTVKYTSVSGFLFLRFFCPAILNPKLFGLIQDLPPDRTKRTFTLIAKSLNVLANTARFGAKEPWMEPMNKFLAASSNDFKSFIDEICTVSSSQISTVNLEPQFAAPNQIRSRLPPFSREGLPCLPFLLDHAKLMAQLVDLWIKHAPENIESIEDESVEVFHELCLRLGRRSRACLVSGDQGERPEDQTESTWQRVLTDQEKGGRSTVIEDQLRARAENDITALPQTADAITDIEDKNVELSPVAGEGDTTPSSSASAAWDKRIPFPHRGTETRALTNSTNSSTASLDIIEEVRPRALPSSRDGPPKTRLFDLMGSSSRWKGKSGDRSHSHSHADDDKHE